MVNQITVAVIGMGGYGETYVKDILNCSHELGIQCVGMVDVKPENCRLYNQILEQGIPVYTDMDALYANATPQLVLIATPIQFHCAQVCYAMEHGSHVLCEKPAAATLEQIKIMKEVSQRTGKLLGIGFQKCFSEAILKAKKDVLDGRYGKLLWAKSGIIMRRGLSYYERGWTGKIKAGNNYIYDSVANNSAAHYLQNMLFMAGDGLTASAAPAEIRAELYRVNDIENFDTISAVVTTQNGAELFFVSTHAADGTFNFHSCHAYEKGMIFFDEKDNVVGKLDSGEEIHYGSSAQDTVRKLQCAIEAVRGENTLYCDIDTATPHTTFIQYIQDNVPIEDLQSIAKLRDNAYPGATEPSYQRYIPGMTEAVIASYENRQMLSKTLFGR